jgi:hypothetical protein
MKRVPDPAPYRRSSHWTVKGSLLGGPTAWAVGTIPCRQASRQTLRTETGGLQDVRPDSGTICGDLVHLANPASWPGLGKLTPFFNDHREDTPCLRLSIPYAPVTAMPMMKTMDTKYVLAGFVEEAIVGA